MTVDNDKSQTRKHDQPFMMYFDLETKERLEVMARRDDVSLAEMVRRSVNEKFEREEKELISS